MAILENKFQQKWIAGMKVNAKHFAGFERHVSEGHLGNFDIAEVTIFKGAVFKTATSHIQSGKIALLENTPFIFSNREAAAGEILVFKLLVGVISH